MFVFVGLSVLAVLLVQFSRGTSLFKPTRYNLYLMAKKRGRAKAAGEHPYGGCAGRNGCTDIELNPQGDERHNHFEGLHEIPNSEGRRCF